MTDTYKRAREAVKVATNKGYKVVRMEIGKDTFRLEYESTQWEKQEGSRKKK